MKYLFGVFALFFAVSITHAQWQSNAGDVPAYNHKPPAKGEVLPPILTQKQLTDMGATMPAQREAYKAAAKIPAVLHQLPCYCYCDRNHGHKSLHSCFEGAHGANCGTCVQEALYAYKMSKKGWTASQIREGIIRGEFKQLDLQNPEPVL